MKKWSTFKKPKIRNTRVMFKDRKNRKYRQLKTMIQKRECKR